jgi:hypothetical protein
LIGYVLLVAKRRRTIDKFLSALAAILVLSMGLFIIEAAGEAAPREEILVALLR